MFQDIQYETNIGTNYPVNVLNAKLNTAQNYIVANANTLNIGISITNNEKELFSCFFYMYPIRMCKKNLFSASLKSLLLD